MTASSSHRTTVATTVTIDVTPKETKDRLLHQSSNAGGALVTTPKGTFSAFLAPLTQDSFKRVVTDVEQRLEVVNQTLSMLLGPSGFDNILHEMLSAITLKTRELLGADRSTIFLLDEEKNQLWSIVAEGEDGQPLELRIPADKGIAGEVATYKKVVNIPYDFYDDPRSTFAQKKDQETGYRTYTMLVLPLLNQEGDLVAVVQLLNKLKFPNDDPASPLAERIDLAGFTEEDQRVFQEFAPSIRLILESSRAFYMATQRQRAADALINATESLSKCGLDLEETLKRVMDEAKKLMNADRSTLWLLDEERNDLWTKIPQADGSLKEMRVDVGVGFAGKVAQTSQTLNIGFDLYLHPDSDNSKKFDKSTGYRTCSLLCMPVFNSDGKLIGVTQLVNKKKQGDHPNYDPNDWPNAPECWRASFNQTDEAFMEAFNIQAGVALQNAKLFETVKQQEQMQRDILRSLSNGVISTDKAGNIIAANESAKKLLGIAECDRIEGKSVRDIIKIKEGDFDKWFGSALAAEEEKARQQYYPDRTLISTGVEEHSINLSINTMADVSDPCKVSGALVVMDDISDEKRLKSTMYRYMTQELAEQLLSTGDAKLGGDRKEVTVLFSDIRSYTTLTESMQAEEVVQMLNEYFESMVDAVFKHKGTLDKYIGDAIMAVFGSPLPLEDHAWCAVQTAIEMRHRLAEFNQRRREAKKQEIKIGIGINSDIVISGNIGSSKRMEFTAIGDGVNLGSRLEGASKQYGCDIVISESTFHPCAKRIWYRELDQIRVKGKTQPVKIYELVGLQSEPLEETKQQIIELYHRGREYYLNRKFTRAMGEFGTILEDIAQDKAASLYLERCQQYLKNPPPDDWDGVYSLTEK
ncbi:GAF domain-containing protein [Microseira sp. BLCC-F43]|jgi:adenylate cyclase|uniref:GAF domain-containing protein n=1 Tax=Microseira sp. BLCC-F43 TaxID=3153602 RepID=UPI0035BA441C